MYNSLSNYFLVIGLYFSFFWNNVSKNPILKDNFFFYFGVSFTWHSWFTGQQGKGEAISVTPLYHFHLLYRHLDISRAITAERSSSLRLQVAKNFILMNQNAFRNYYYFLVHQFNFAENPMKLAPRDQLVTCFTMLPQIILSMNI